MGVQWAFVGRNAERAEFTAALDAGLGVLIAGPEGVGKSALAARVVVDRGYPPTHLVGHAVGGPTPFAAFAGLVSADERGAVAVAQVAERVAARLRDTGGSAPVVLVDDVDLLDSQSLRVLILLAAAGRILPVLTCRPDVPMLVQRLVVEGRCQRIELDGLSRDEVDEALRRALGGPVEAAAGYAFYVHSDGNPYLLRELVIASVRSGVLHEVNGAWVLTGTPTLGGGIRDLVDARFAALPHTLFAAAESVAAGEPLPLPVARALLGDHALDALADADLITVNESPAGPVVAMTRALYGDVIRTSMPATRLRRLRLTLAERLAGHDGSAHDVVRAMQWRMDSGFADNPESLLAAAAAARAFDLDLAERLARRACSANASVRSSVLLAEILTHRNRTAEADEILAALPPDTLDPADRDALLYCRAIGHGLAVGDAGAGARMVSGSDPEDNTAALRAVHASLLAFDARLAEAETLGAPLAADPDTDPTTLAFAALAVVGAACWQGRTADTVRLCDALLPVARSARGAAPFAGPSLQLFAACALIESGHLDRADARIAAMLDSGLAEGDPFAATRAQFCQGRSLLARGRAMAAAGAFRRCTASVEPFDRAFLGTIYGYLARAEAMAGNIGRARQALDEAQARPRVASYEAEHELACAAVDAADLRLMDAAERAATAGLLASRRNQMPLALQAFHEAARYGAALDVATAARRAAGVLTGPLPATLIAHIDALVAGDVQGLARAGNDMIGLGYVGLGAEALDQAADLSARDGRLQAARGWASRAAAVRRHDDVSATPWLVGPATVPLTHREREVAGLASSGYSDAQIARRLDLSVRTVETHLARVYHKWGLSGRHELASRLQLS